MKKNRLNTLKALEEYEEDKTMKMKEEKNERELVEFSKKQEGDSLYYGLLNRIKGAWSSKWVEREYIFTNSLKIDFNPDYIQKRLIETNAFYFMREAICSALNKIAEKDL